MKPASVGDTTNVEPARIVGDGDDLACVPPCPVTEGRRARTRPALRGVSAASVAGPATTAPVVGAAAAATVSTAAIGARSRACSAGGLVGMVGWGGAGCFPPSLRDMAREVERREYDDA